MLVEREKLASRGSPKNLWPNVKLSSTAMPRACLSAPYLPASDLITGPPPVIRFSVASAGELEPRLQPTLPETLTRARSSIRIYNRFTPASEPDPPHLCSRSSHPSLRYSLAAPPQYDSTSHSPNFNHHHPPPLLRLICFVLVLCCVSLVSPLGPGTWPTNKSTYILYSVTSFDFCIKGTFRL